MNCKDAIALMSDYLEMLCGQELLRDLEQHLQDCAPCRAYLATLRATRDLTHVAGQVEMPPEMKARLRQFLLARLSSAEN
jgi:predicted anti-sigma-YlaC factor YlaD